MNLPAILVGAVLALAAPAGYLALTDATLDPRQPGRDLPTENAIEPLAGSDLGSGLVRFRVHHDGDPVDATMRIVDGDGNVLEERTAVLKPSTDTTFELEVPLGLYEGEIEANDEVSLVSRASFTGGSGLLDLAECEGHAAEFLFQTYAMATQQGIIVPGAQCLDGPERHVSMEHVGAATTTPHPTCALDCEVSYVWWQEGGALEFEVGEASAIEIAASLGSGRMTTGSYSVWLARPSGCDGCWEVVASETIGEGVSFEYPNPAPGDYALIAFLEGPVSVSAEEYVWLMASVVPV